MSRAEGGTVSARLRTMMNLSRRMVIEEKWNETGKERLAFKAFITTASCPNAFVRSYNTSSSAAALMHASEYSLACGANLEGKW